MFVDDDCVDSRSDLGHLKSVLTDGWIDGLID